jgi:hypothetical protein
MVEKGDVLENSSALGSWVALLLPGTGIKSTSGMGESDEILCAPTQPIFGCHGHRSVIKKRSTFWVPFARLSPDYGDTARLY